MTTLVRFLNIAVCVLAVASSTHLSAQDRKGIRLKLVGQDGYYDPYLDRHVSWDEHHRNEYERATQKLAKPVEQVDPLCRKRLLDTLEATGAGRIFVGAMKKAFGPQWLSKIPALTLPTSQERAEAGRFKGGTGYIDYIVASELEQLGTAIAWGCDEYRRPFIAVVYDVYMLNKQDILKRGIVQTFFLRYTEIPDVWMLAGTGYLGATAGSGLVRAQDFEDVVTLLKDGFVTVKGPEGSQNYPFVELHIPRFASRN